MSKLFEYIIWGIGLLFGGFAVFVLFLYVFFGIGNEDIAGRAFLAAFVPIITFPIAAFLNIEINS